MLEGDGICHRSEVTMGDKSPKSKQRNKKQKTASKEESAVKAKAKQSAQGQEPPKAKKK